MFWGTISIRANPFGIGLGLTDIFIRHCIGLGTGAVKHGGFQLYSVLPETTVAPIPDSLTFANAAVLPLPLSTAAAGLYQADFLALPFPSKEAKPTGKSLLVWSGSSSVGSAAIQLAVASGLTVATTASKRNQEYVRSLGAVHVFDYDSPTVVDEIDDALKNTLCAGAIDCVSKPTTIKASAEVLHRLGGSKKLVTVTSPPEDLPEGVQAKGGEQFECPTTQVSFLSESR